MTMWACCYKLGSLFSQLLLYNNEFSMKGCCTRKKTQSKFTKKKNYVLLQLLLLLLWLQALACSLFSILDYFVFSLSFFITFFFFVFIQVICFQLVMQELNLQKNMLARNTQHRERGRERKDKANVKRERKNRTCREENEIINEI